MSQITPQLLERVNNWLTPTFDKDTQDHIKNLMDNDIC